MSKENIVKKKSFKFSVRIVKLYKYLIATHKEYVIPKQLLRCGTSVGAQIVESENAQSRADFIHKLSISQKEIDETMYWLDLLKETDYLSETEHASIYENANEIKKLLTAILKKLKSNSKD